jgi:integrase
MPLKLKAPRKGKSPNWSIRGTYLGIGVDKSCGTARRSVALQKLRELEAAIERGEYPPKAKTHSGRLGEKTFLSAARAYLEAGRRRRYVGPLIRYFGETPIGDIDQDAIDEAAAAILPHGLPQTRNTCVYTPVSAIIRFAGVDLKLRRPKDAKGRVVTDALNPPDAEAIIKAADSFDMEYGILLRMLLYTGVRLGEALQLEWEMIRLEECRAWIRARKNGDPLEVQLRGDLVAALEAHPRRAEAGRVFRFRQGGNLKHKLVRARMMALGMDCPARRPKGWRQPPHRLSWVNHHTFRHTWATWMRRYAGADVDSLLATKNWRDPRSTRRYVHVSAREEWGRVEKLPSLGGKNVESRRG